MSANLFHPTVVGSIQLDSHLLRRYGLHRVARASPRIAQRSRAHPYRALAA